MLLLISMIEIITISKVSNSIIVISLTPVSEGRIEPPTVMQHPGQLCALRTRLPCFYYITDAWICQISRYVLIPTFSYVALHFAYCSGVFYVIFSLVQQGKIIVRPVRYRYHAVAVHVISDLRIAVDYYFL